MSKPKTVKEITEQFLTANGFDGLCSDSCGCEVGDLFPCMSEDTEKCSPGYKVPCKPDRCDVGGCEWHISTKKPRKRMA